MSTVPVPQAFAAALQHHQAGRLRDAEALYREILAAQPHHTEARHYLGVLANQTGHHAQAVELIGQAITLQPANPAAHSNLGEAYYSQGRLDEAMASYRRALALKPDLPQTNANLGNALRDRGRLDEAIAAYRRALQLKPDYAEAWNNLGNVLRDQNQFDEAIAAYRRALQLRPDHPEIHNNLGATLAAQGQLDEAISAYQRALQLKPDYAEAHNNLGVALAAQGQLDQAVSAYRRALQLRPDYAEAHNNLGAALADQGCLDEALAAHRRALQLQPNHPEAHNNLGTIFQEQGHLGEAIAAYRHALQLQPDYSSAKLNYSLLLLRHGDFEHGWSLYESRWDALHYAPRRFAQPRWDGSPLHGQRVLLHAEQGLGDSIQFIRYAPLVAQRGGCVVVECQPGLKPLLATSEGVSQVLEYGEPLPDFDWHCPMMSLPLAFGTRVETIPATIPYLRADASKAARWRERLDQETGLADGMNPSPRPPVRVGLFWAGGIRPHQPNSLPTDRRRSMHLHQFKPLAAVPGVVFISLQKGPPATQAQSPPEGLNLLDWTDELHDFADTAALVEALDLVIGVDTAVAHVAGALGKPIWLLNRFDTCWRWGLDREETPWYPTMRLFRQPAPGEWDPVIQQVVLELSRLAASFPQS